MHKAVLCVAGGMSVHRIWKSWSIGRSAGALALLAAAIAPCSGSAIAQPGFSAASRSEQAARRALQERVAALGQAFRGEVGIAVRDVDSGFVASWNGNRLFPQQSVSKFWVQLTAMDAVDRKRLRLDQQITVKQDDLTLFSQPIAAQVGTRGFTTTLGDLMHRAITRSDNTANDVVLWQAGGPTAVREFIRKSGIEGVRFGPGERLLQSGIAGVTWNQALSRSGAFEAARAQVPAATRRRLFDSYVQNPTDGASPLGLTEGLAKLRRGELLSAQSTRHILTVMAQTRTGPNRLAGGLAPGWSIAHKTGTGQQLGGEQAGYNDIGIITAPDGKHYALAVVIGRTSVPNIVRMNLMNEVTRAAIQYHGARRAGSYARN
jgi:beta-lactamase class A